MSNDMIRWDKDNLLHREIMDANKEAWIAREVAEYEESLAEYRAKVDAIVAALPWWARLYLRIVEWWHR